MATIQQMAQWIKANQNKIGSPEFQTVAAAYQQERQRIKSQVEAENQQWMAERTDPTQGMGTGQRLAAGAGKAFTDIARGVGQIAGVVPQEDIDAAKHRDAALMQTGAGMAGNIGANIGIAAPFMMVPGANTVIGGAASGAAFGALQPTASNESRAQNMAVGGALGAAVPAATKMWKTGKAALVDPFTESGRQRIAGSLLRRASANPDMAAQRLSAASGATPGFTPTVGQAADDAGLASLERTMRAIDPRGFDEVEKAQRGALIDALRGVAGTPEARARAIAEADTAVAPLYDSARKTVVESDEIIEALMGRPSMQAAKTRAQKLASERGGRLAITAPQQAAIGAPKASIVSEPSLRPATAAELLRSPKSFYQEGSLKVSAPSASLPANYNGQTLMETLSGQRLRPGTFSGSALHDMKMGLDDAIGSPGLGGMQGAERNAALGTKGEYLNWLESKIPEYGQAKSLYAQKMRPVNQMDVGQALYEKLVPALADQGGIPFRSNAQQYANALRNADDLTRNVTGMKGATFSGVMDPSQINTLQGVAKDLSTRAAAETIGRGAGSDTVQKIAMSNIASEAGVPTWLSNIAAAPGGWAKRLGDIFYGSADDQVRSALSDLMKNPAEAAAVMRQVGVPEQQISEAFKLAARSSALSVPASVNAGE